MIELCDCMNVATAFCEICNWPLCGDCENEHRCRIGRDEEYPSDQGQFKDYTEFRAFLADNPAWPWTERR